MLIGYMRVSSDNDRQSTDLQRDALIAAGVDRRHLFEDRASGAKDDRPGLAKALDFVQPGDVLVVWKLDRLGRSLSHLLTIVTTLRERQVAFHSLTEGMDTTTSSGEFLFHVFGALAQYERALTHERVMAGLAAAQRRGRRGVVPHPPERALHLHQRREVDRPRCHGGEPGSRVTEFSAVWAYTPEVVAPVAPLDAHGRVRRQVGGRAPVGLIELVPERRQLHRGVEGVVERATDLRP
jgi:DNA invertase Pin-like site-specific DNA recombinase